MLYTVTFNPSLDYYLKVNNIKQGAVNRAAGEKLIPGGKGINVSLELKELGDETMALGFVAGFTGRAILEEIKARGLNSQFIEVDGQTRINVKIKSVAETDINGEGALVTPADVDELTKKLKKNLKAGDWVILSGSVPPSLTDSAYSDFLDKLAAPKGVNIVIDACGKLLTSALRHRPFLIKPNIFELCQIFGIPHTSDTRKIAECARELQKQGARNVIVSMGADGGLTVLGKISGRKKAIRTLADKIITELEDEDNPDLDDADNEDLGDTGEDADLEDAIDEVADAEMVDDTNEVETDETNEEEEA